MRVEDFVCVLDHAMSPVTVLVALPILALALLAEYRHVDWLPTLEWARGLFAAQSAAHLIALLDHYFLVVLPRMLGHRVYGQWIEYKRWGWWLLGYLVVVWVITVIYVDKVC
jgi:hypothetical protein